MSTSLIPKAKFNIPFDLISTRFHPIQKTSIMNQIFKNNNIIIHTSKRTRLDQIQLPSNLHATKLIVGSTQRPILCISNENNEHLFGINLYKDSTETKPVYTVMSVGVFVPVAQSPAQPQQKATVTDKLSVTKQMKSLDISKTHPASWSSVGQSAATAGSATSKRQAKQTSISTL